MFRKQLESVPKNPAILHCKKGEVMKKFFLSSILLIALLNQHELTAQVSIGADIMSRYIWRGVDYGNSPSLQPQLSFSAGGFSIGTWGAYSFAGSASSFSEIGRP